MILNPCIFYVSIIISLRQVIRTKIIYCFAWFGLPVDSYNVHFLCIPTRKYIIYATTLNNSLKSFPLRHLPIDIHCSHMCHRCIWWFSMSFCGYRPLHFSNKDFYLPVDNNSVEYQPELLRPYYSVGSESHKRCIGAVGWSVLLVSGSLGVWTPVATDISRINRLRELQCQTLGYRCECPWSSELTIIKIWPVA